MTPDAVLIDIDGVLHVGLRLVLRRHDTVRAIYAR